MDINYSSDAAKDLYTKVQQCTTDLRKYHNEAMEAWTRVVDSCFQGGGEGNDFKTKLKEVKFTSDVDKICAEIDKICLGIANIDQSWKDAAANITSAVDDYNRRANGESTSLEHTQ